MFDLALEGPVARLSLNRPEARNAIARDQWPVLAEKIDAVATSDARVLVLQSRDPAHFCAGADFKDFEAMAGDPGAQAQMRRAMRDALDRIAALPIPVIASVEGGCFGAGVALALACDIRIAGHAAHFAIPPARLGITYPHEDIARLVDLTGPGRAARLLFSAERITADEALALGLVEIVASSAWEASGQLAATIADNAPSSLALLKQSIALARSGVRQSEALDAAFDAAFDSPELAEGLAAIREKRRPEFGE